MPDAAILDAVREVLSDKTLRASLGLSAFGLDQQDLLDKHETQLQGMLSDRSLGMSQNGPVWMDGVSVIDATITANKLVVNTLESITANTGDLNVTGTATLAASFPATTARIEMDSAGILGYNSGGITNTFKLNTDGSGFFGVGATAMTWTTAGVVTIPAASIGSLTIANVGGGILGGTYQTAATGQHINISTSGIVAYNATSEISANETFRLNAATGAMTATGSFTVKSAATGAHVTIDSAGGVAGYNATSEVAGNRTFLLNAATGAGHLGLSTGSNISWDSAGAVSIQGSLIVTGTVTADRITTGTLTSGATVNLGTADVVVNSSGKLKFGSSSADYLANDLIHFEVGTGSSAKIEFKNSSNTYNANLEGFGGSTSTGLQITALKSTDVKSKLIVTSSGSDSGNYVEATTYINASGTTGATYRLDGAGSHNWTIGAGNPGMTLVSSNAALSLAGRLYPGTGSATQSTRYIYDNGSQIQVMGGDFALQYALVMGTGTSGGWAGMNVGGSVANWSSGWAAGAYMQVAINGTVRRIPYFADA